MVYCSTQHTADACREAWLMNRTALPAAASPTAGHTNVARAAAVGGGLLDGGGGGEDVTADAGAGVVG